MSRASPSLWLSLVLGVLAFALDRGHKFLQVSADCIGAGPGVCLDYPASMPAVTAFGWHGGDYLRVTDFFDYVLVWNRGISYGLLTALPAPVLGVGMAIAIVLLCVWWAGSPSALIRCGLALCIGGAASNALDRWLYGAVADFFHFHWQQYSFYIFNFADSAITLGVILLLLDFVGVGRRKTV